MRAIFASAAEIVRPLVGFKTVQNVQMLCRCGPLDAWFTYFPLLGNEIQYILVSPFLAWCCGADGQTAMRHFTLISFGACWISNSLKELFKLRRPPAALQVGNSDVERVSLQYGFLPRIRRTPSRWFGFVLDSLTHRVQSLPPTQHISPCFRFSTSASRACTSASTH